MYDLQISGGRGVVLERFPIFVCGVAHALTYENAPLPHITKAWRKKAMKLAKQGDEVALNWLYNIQDDTQYPSAFRRAAKTVLANPIGVSPKLPSLSDVVIVTKMIAYYRHSTVQGCPRTQLFIEEYVRYLTGELFHVR